MLPLYANGVAIVDGKNAIYLKLVKSEVTVTVESQVAIVKSKQYYRNELGADKVIKYGFPLPQSATATNLVWKLNGFWYQASFSATPQDTTTPGPGGEMDEELENYLGDTPIFYDFEQPIKSDSIIIIELSYVQLLPYDFGDVQFEYPADYSPIQSTMIEEHSLNFTLSSQRIITSLELLSSHPVTQLVNSDTVAFLQSVLYESVASENYLIKFTISREELGLFDFSTFLSPDDTPDNIGGFFLFIAEPDPQQNAETVQKRFTLIIDRSGSMTGSKITQAKGAATYIVNNLNEGDKFNIIDYATEIYSFRTEHIDYNMDNRDLALTYISQISAFGGTNISGAFEVAIPQFGTANDSTANIILFFTDGQPTIGITLTETLISHIQTLINQVETRISLFNFGIGTSVDNQLLIQLASQNNGFADFLAADVLEEKISTFYDKIRNPVILDTKISFAPNVVSQTYPNPIPDIYKGQQMLVAGRYIESVPTMVTLNGKGAFAEEVTYEYALNLADSVDTKYQFLPKIWAKLKIEHLLVQYYILDPESSEALDLKQQIIDLSLSYGVISPFTSFTNPTPIEELIKEEQNIPGQYVLLGNYPNPFNPSTKIKIKVGSALNRIIKVNIYNSLGQLVRVLSFYISAAGEYEIFWDGKISDGDIAPTGAYIYVVDFGDALLAGKMFLVK